MVRLLFSKSPLAGVSAVNENRYRDYGANRKSTAARFESICQCRSGDRAQDAATGQGFDDEGHADRPSKLSASRARASILTSRSNPNDRWVIQVMRADGCCVVCVSVMKTSLLNRHAERRPQSIDKLSTLSQAYWRTPSHHQPSF